jgi:hypothetical protein
MTTNRREFIERLGATAMLGALPVGALHPMMSSGETLPIQSQAWDFTWVNSLKGKKHKAIFDNTEIENGYGVWRSSVWELQYHETMGVKPADTRTIMVLRHNAIALAFNQALWDQLAIGASEKVSHPVTLQSTDRNPALLSAARNEVPAPIDAFSLPNFQKRGGVVLACNLALQFFAGAFAKKAGITQEEAMKRATAAILPGVILQPSGVMACVRAQEEGCVYVRAS